LQFEEEESAAAAARTSRLGKESGRDIERRRPMGEGRGGGAYKGDDARTWGKRPMLCLTSTVRRAQHRERARKE
jgi:hypothetical protein